MRGPTLTFDKSTLQSLTIDESVWLNHFYSCVITPVFFSETVADLDKKKLQRGEAEKQVSLLAYKTPESAVPHVHYWSIVLEDLSGQLDMKVIGGRPIIAGGKTVELGNKTGTYFIPSIEQKTLARWQDLDFIEYDRLLAKYWRSKIGSIDLNNLHDYGRTWFQQIRKPKSMIEAKDLATLIIEGYEPEKMIRDALGTKPEVQGFIEDVVQRWRQSGYSTLEQCYPYFTYFNMIRMFFHIAVASDLISPGRQTNAIDIEYLFYLPFVNIFVSNDKLHAKVAPIFLRPDQTFVDGTELKRDLNKLDSKYKSLPIDVRSQGIYKFALTPPLDDEFLTTELWRKYLCVNEPSSESSMPLSTSELENIQKDLKKLREGSETNLSIPSDSLDYFVIENRIRSQKGSWIIVPETLQENGQTPGTT